MPKEQLEAEIKEFEKKGGSGTPSKQNAYSGIAKLDDFIYTTTYDELDYGKAKSHFEKLRISNTNVETSKVNRVFNKLASCSAFKWNGMLCRSYDWSYSNVAEFKVKTDAKDGRNEVKGIAMQTSLNASDVDSGEYNELFDIMPFSIVDGVNDKGLAMAVLVVPCDKGVTVGTIPNIEAREEICNLMLVRYCLDKFSSIRQAVDYLQNYVSVYTTQSLVQMGYELHFFMVEESGYSGALEFVGNSIVFHECDILTNFYIDGTIFNEKMPNMEDGSVYTPATQDAEHDAMRTNQITQYGSGLERYNLINSTLPTLKSKNDLVALLMQLFYTNSYKRTTNPFWYTEFVGGNYFCNTDPKEFDAEDGIVGKAIAAFERRSRETAITWQSVHSGAIDVASGEMSFVFQENPVIYSFKDDYYTKDAIDKVAYRLYVPRIRLRVEDIEAEEPIIDNLTEDELQTLLSKNGRVVFYLSEQGVEVDFNFRASFSGDLVSRKLNINARNDEIVFCYTSTISFGDTLNYTLLVLSSGQAIVRVSESSDDQDYISYSEYQYLSEYEFNIAMANLQLGCSKNTYREIYNVLSMSGLNVPSVDYVYTINKAQVREQILNKEFYNATLDFGKFQIFVDNGNGFDDIPRIEFHQQTDIGVLEQIAFDYENETITVTFSHVESELPNLAGINIERFTEHRETRPMDLSLIPHDEIINNVIYNNLTTEQKQIVGAINEVNLKSLPSYDQKTTQVLKNINGVLVWVTEE